MGEEWPQGKSQVSARPAEEGVVRAMRTYGSLWITGVALEGARKGYERKMLAERLDLIKNTQH